MLPAKIPALTAPIRISDPPRKMSRQRITTTTLDYLHAVDLLRSRTIPDSLPVHVQRGIFFRLPGSNRQESGSHRVFKVLRFEGSDERFASERLLVSLARDPREPVNVMSPSASALFQIAQSLDLSGVQCSAAELRYTGSIHTAFVSNPFRRKTRNAQFSSPLVLSRYPSFYSACLVGSAGRTQKAPGAGPWRPV